MFNLSDHSEVRLINGKDSSEGWLKVKYEGKWGNVCATGFGEKDAKVVCRMLGFETRYLWFSYYTICGANLERFLNNIIYCQKFNYIRQVF